MNTYTLGIDIGSTTVKIVILDENEKLLFADYERHFANIQETLADLAGSDAIHKLGPITLYPRLSPVPAGLLSPNIWRFLLFRR